MWKLPPGYMVAVEVLAVLAASIVFLFVILGSVAHADQLPASVSSSGIINLSALPGSTIVPIDTSSSAYVCYFEGPNIYSATNRGCIISGSPTTFFSLIGDFGHGSYPSTDLEAGLSVYGDGQYWLYVSGSGDHYGTSYGHGYWFGASRSGGVWASTGLESPGMSRIIAIYPLTGTITASTSVPVSITYYASTTDLVPLSRVVYSVTDVTKGWIDSPKVISDAILGTVTIFNANLNLIEGDYYQLHIGLESDPDADIYHTLTASTTDPYFYVVSAGGLLSQIGVASTSDIWSIATSTCSIGNIAGCIQNALVWAFWPSESAWDDIATVGDSVKTKPPFGLVQYITTIESLGSTTSTSSALVIIEPYMDTFFRPLRASLSIIIFVAFAIWLFKRVRSHDI
jgi:hypothetical protein